jgi:hypothetical protein
VKNNNQMKTFISVLALAAIAAADNHEAAAEETAWVLNAACGPFEATLLIKFANAIQSGLEPV